MYHNAQYVMLPPAVDPSMIKVDINGTTWFVPLDPANTDYQNILALVEAGDLVIAPAEEPTE
jgi:hypothetical protein